MSGNYSPQIKFILAKMILKESISCAFFFEINFEVCQNIGTAVHVHVCSCVFTVCAT